MEHCPQVADSKGRQVSSLQEVRFEELLLSIATCCSAVPVGEDIAHIQEAQRLIWWNLGVELCSLWQWSDKQLNLFSLTHFLSRPPWSGTSGRPIDTGSFLFEIPAGGKQVACGELVEFDELPSITAISGEGP